MDAQTRHHRGSIRNEFSGYVPASSTRQLSKLEPPQPSHVVICMISRNKGLGYRLGVFGLFVRVASLILPLDQGEGGVGMACPLPVNTLIK
jgi:hypothetical protein